MRVGGESQAPRGFNLREVLWYQFWEETGWASAPVWTGMEYRKPVSNTASC
jgi:hypothetical protein